MGLNTRAQSQKMKAFVCLSLLAAASSAPSGPVVVGYGGGQTSHQSVSRPYGEQRSIVQSKAFGAAHASVSQVDNAKGLSEIQPAIGANKPVAVGHAAVVPVALMVSLMPFMLLSYTMLQLFMLSMPPQLFTMPL